MSLVDLNSNYINVGAITILREDFGYKKIIKIDLDLLDSTIEDTHFLYNFLKSVKEDVKKGNQLDIHWIINGSKKESIAMGKDFEKLMNLTFQYLHRQ